MGRSPGFCTSTAHVFLLIYRGGCAVNCRYCFRRHFPYQDRTLARHDLDAVVRYLEAHSEVNEVIFSGGDPLMAGDESACSLFPTTGGHSYIRRLRIHTRLPVVIPDRVTDTFCQDCIDQIPVVVVLHVNHANEIDEAVVKAVLDYEGMSLDTQSSSDLERCK